MSEKQTFDPKQVDWVDAPSAPTPEQPKASKPGLRVLAVVGGGILAIVLLVVFVVSIVNNVTRRSAEVTPQMQDDIQRAIADCRQMDDPQACIDRIAQELAQENGNGDYCMDLNGQPYIDCITLAAISAGDESLCGRISGNDDARATCNDSVLSRTVRNPEDVSECKRFMKAENIEDCEREWELSAILTDECSSLGIDSELCGYGQVVLRAQEAQDPDICDEITDEDYLGYCHQVVEPGDRDFDGLDEFTEEDLGTDDRNPDTDGDGYSDYEEVQNGFDPLS